jgi:hypothetical protein
MRTALATVGHPKKKEPGVSAARVENEKAIWQFDFAEVTGHNLETRGRKEVNRLLAEGWRLLLVYTLRYEQDGVWRERPMAILGRPRENPAVTQKMMLFAAPEAPALFPGRMQ